MDSELNLRGLVSCLTRADCDFVVIGSSALAIHGWGVSPADLDVMAESSEVATITAALEVGDGDADWVEDGAAKRLECRTQMGPVDIYVEVSGGLTYETVAREAVPVLLEDTEEDVRVGSLTHVRDMRAAVGRDSLPREAVLPAAKDGVPRVVAIDGPAGAGKSTVSRGVASKLGFTYLNTGAMYRCVTLAVLERSADTDDHAAIEEIANQIEIDFSGEQVFLDGRDVSGAIRDEAVTEATPHVAAYPEVREAMIARQRQLFSKGGYVAEGRDTGTVVARDAPLKVYLTASIDERAQRRSLETGEPIADVKLALADRDQLDSERELSALRIAEDAVLVDSTGRSVEDVVDEIEALARERGVA
ncbi:MAG TPA: (d)CMP kinase [Solirubrobacterales bacterium]|nr:(d)CMP kinase [Solirubrobacterales bacterium]